jgi:protein-tyrosine-phosphatase
LRLQRLRLRLLQEVTYALFVCVVNQGRSVMAERPLRRAALDDDAIAWADVVVATCVAG